MRTTLSIDTDAVKLAREHARRRRITLGEAVSELVRKGAQQPLLTQEVNGLHVVRLPEHSPEVTAERVDELLEEFP